MQDSGDKTAAPKIDPDALRRKYAEERAKRLRPDATAQFQPWPGDSPIWPRILMPDPNFTRESGSR